MLHRRIEAWLLGTQAVGLATLIRSVAFDRWITVLASALMIVGAIAALRGRTWGVVLSFASAAAFPVAWAIGIAPLWFVYVGVIGAMPLLLATSALARVDRQATAVLVGLAASAGAIAAVTWKLVAWDLFMAFPALRPSVFPQHGLAVVALLGIGVAAMVASLRTARRAGQPDEVASEPSRTRIGVGAVDAGADVAETAERESESEAEAEPRARHEARAPLPR